MIARSDRKATRLPAAIAAAVVATFACIVSPPLPVAARAAEPGPRPGQQNPAASAEAQLEVVLPEINVDGVAMRDVMDLFADAMNVNLFVNWNALEAAGVEQTTPVTLHLRQVTVGKALEIVLEAVGGGAGNLDYLAEGNILTVATAEQLVSRTITRMYDIRDLIVNIPDFTDGPSFLAQEGLGGADAAGGLFAIDDDDEYEEEGPTREELVENIIKLLTDTVEVESWIDNGGPVGAIRELNGQLIITQTERNHRRVDEVLRGLQEQRAMQVTVDHRLVRLDDETLDKLEAGLREKLKDADRPAAAADPAKAPGAAAAATGRADAIYLDDAQVQQVLAASRAGAGGLGPTRLTLFNGQRTWTGAVSRRPYVSGLRAIELEGRGGKDDAGDEAEAKKEPKKAPKQAPAGAVYEPEVSEVDSGYVFDTTVTLSADRRTVTLTERAEVAVLRGMDDVPFKGMAGDLESTLQTPTLDVYALRTSLAMPAGRTVLLGGWTLSDVVIADAPDAGGGALFGGAAEGEAGGKANAAAAPGRPRLYLMLTVTVTTPVAPAGAERPRLGRLPVGNDKEEGKGQRTTEK